MITCVIKIAFVSLVSMMNTNKDVVTAVRALGLIARYVSEYAEWRIDYRQNDARKTADSAYFTNDRQDAYQTSVAMANWQKGIF